MIDNVLLKITDLEQQVTTFIPCFHKLEAQHLVCFDPSIELRNINSIESANFNIKMFLQTICEENRLEIASIYLANGKVKKASRMLTL